ncbi:MAG TPA: DUF5677 domain-containing protein [Bacilli bacterium]|nr:DUF5677 domain-containing protein [Bacilli bacterium]HOR20418.1 DUF5677 domain-containing protein [Bacilli bacterium]
MSKQEVISFEQFQDIYKALGVKESLDSQFLYDVYQNAMEGAKSIDEANLLGRVVPVNPIALILYIVNEHGYYLDIHPDAAQEAVIKDEKYMQMIVSIALDKYYTNEHLSYKSKTILSRFSPGISTLNTYLNFVLGVLGRYSRNQPNETLIVDIMSKGFSMARAISDLLVSGFETEAFSTWRTLHEAECILLVLTKYGKPVIDKYLLHMNYAMAFRGLAGDKEKTDAIFTQIKGEMRTFDLKSKDMKRFIEYGWLLKVSALDKAEPVKLNFRDGLEKTAGLKRYAPIYEMSSEIAHSSPLLIYSRREYFMHLALVNVYESFFRLEKIFAEIYVRSISESEKQRFLLMRKIYYGQLVSLHAQERAKMRKMAGHSKKQ